MKRKGVLRSLVLAPSSFGFVREVSALRMFATDTLSLHSFCLVRGSLRDSSFVGLGCWMVRMVRGYLSVLGFRLRAVV